MQTSSLLYFCKKKKKMQKKKEQMKQNKATLARFKTTENHAERKFLLSRCEYIK